MSVIRVAAPIVGARLHNAEAVALLCEKKGGIPPAPDGGWEDFFDQLILRRVESGTDKIFLNTVIRHQSTGTEYKFSEKLGGGTFGRVASYVSLHAPSSIPSKLALKAFIDPEISVNVAEVERVIRMQRIDATRATATRGRARVPDRVPARALYDDTLARPFVVMAYTNGHLPYSFNMPDGAAMGVVRAVYREVMDMYTTYGLLCYDMKTANVLLSCAGGGARVHAADYGGYADMGAEAMPTYPPPWAIKETYSGKTCIMTEEVCVYQFLIFFLELTAGRTDMGDVGIDKFAYDDVCEEIFAKVTNPGSSPKKPTLSEFKDLFFIHEDTWADDVRAMIEYCTRYRPGPANNGMGKYDMTLPG
jgi:hypothetical protein